MSKDTTLIELSAEEWLEIAIRLAHSGETVLSLNVADMVFESRGAPVIAMEMTDESMSALREVNYEYV